MNYKILFALIISGCSFVQNSPIYSSVAQAYSKSDDDYLLNYANKLQYSSILVKLNNKSSLLVLETSENNIHTYVSNSGLRLKFDGTKLIESAGFLNDIYINNFNRFNFLNYQSGTYFVSQTNPNLMLEPANISYKFDLHSNSLTEFVVLPGIYENYRNIFFYGTGGAIIRSSQHVTPKIVLDITYFD
ncbi:hypothetical protein OAE17_04395 [Gammaproteobacteria bacterium]|nr:hypothetical protein [Gammaproteobacteria bacterium]